MNDPRLVRNFSIIAHIDHGKSTLADRLLETTHTISKRKMKEQVLDQMDLEREHGVTIKAQAVRIDYHAKDGKDYILNLIDTPGHVDFSYEVSRSLAACEGALLVVDAAQGVEAQTVANTDLCIANALEIVPVINKIDLPSAQPDRVKHEIEQALAIDAQNAILISAKTGEGIEDILEAIIERVPPPQGRVDAPLKALIFDSVFNSYRGVITYVRVVDGSIATGDKIKMMASGKVAEVEEVGVFVPDMKPVSELSTGEVGYIISGIKDIEETKVGDTVTTAKDSAEKALSGYQEPKSVVFAGIYPVDGGEYESLRDALEKLSLNDASLHYTPETSHALGFGFRCGFLGMFHMEIIKERLEREYDLELLITTPVVAYQITKTDGTELEAKSPYEFPPAGEIKEVREPYIKAFILTPSDYIGAVFELCEERRGEHKEMQYLSEQRVEIEYHFPLTEILMDFYNQLKSKTRGYGSLDYEHIGYQPSDLVKLDILLAGNPVDALSIIVHKDKAYARGRALVKKLKEVIPRQLFEVPVQASLGKKVIARETIRPLRKDVTAKLYGGDVTRKRKLLEKQKAGKKKMKKLGQVEVPPEAFLKILEAEES